jgi:hypothetical protein
MFSHAPDFIKKTFKSCENHKFCSHTTAECKKGSTPQVTEVTTTVVQGNGHPFNAFKFKTTTRCNVGQSVFTYNKSESPSKIDR